VIDSNMIDSNLTGAGERSNTGRGHTASEPESRTPSSKIVLRSTEFRKRREDGWRELDVYVSRIEKRGVVSLSPSELERLPVLYRSAVSSLSVAQSIALDRNLLSYLENLALRAFLVVYGPRINLWQGVKDFLRRGFPSAVRDARWHLLIAFVAMAAGCVAGFMLTDVDEEWFTTLTPRDIAGDRGPMSSRDELLKNEIFGEWGGPVQAFAFFANFLFQHNTLVGIMTFSVGLALGVPTLLLLFYQGLTLGSFVALHHHRDLTVEVLGWLSIHGVTEISAIVLCGAAGLMVADKMLFPDRYSRIESLSIHGKQAAHVAVGAMLMFFVAAILEGGFRQLIASTPWRFIIGAATGVLWMAYFVKAGRGEAR
jgi:uncharacterized membrane protein SpoIIM required for sporulation